MYLIRYLLCLILSIIYSFFILPKKEGGEPTINPTIYPIIWRGMVIIPINSKKAIHIHHYVINAFICLLSFFYDIPKVILGFSIGLFIQGLLYKDRMKFICDNPWSTKS